MAEPCERTLRSRRRNANELFVEKSNRQRDRNETLQRRRRTDNIKGNEEQLKMKIRAKRLMTLNTLNAIMMERFHSTHCPRPPLYYGNWLHGIDATQIRVTTEDIYKSKTQQWRSHQWSPRLNRYLEMAHTVSGYKTRFIIWSHRYIQTRQISQDVGHFICTILLYQQQNSLNDNQTKGVWSK
jgi:hypothetical protein